MTTKQMPMLRETLTKEFLEKLYLEDGISIRQIAIQYRCGHDWLADRFNELGIPKRSHRDRVRKAMAKVEQPLDPDRLYNLYEVQKLPVTTIAKMTGRGRWDITESLKAMGVHIRSRAEQGRIMSPEAKAERAKKVIAGVRKFAEDREAKRRSILRGQETRRLKRLAEGSTEPGYSRRQRGWYVSTKTGERNFYNSSLELRSFKVLDASSGISYWRKATGIVIEYVNEDRAFPEVSRYWPDLLVNFTDDSTYLIEVKPSFLVSNKIVQAKAIAAESYCFDRGWRFRFWTEQLITDMERLVANPLPSPQKGAGRSND